MSTWLGEQGVRPDVIDRILNHQPRDVTVDTTTLRGWMAWSAKRLKRGLTTSYLLR